jgi:TRAP-type C4-dicarboxylate transport system substrate-binding protein
MIMVLAFCACSGSNSAGSSSAPASTSAASSGTSTTAPASTSTPAPAPEETYTIKFSSNDAAGSLYDELIIQPLQQKLSDKTGGKISLEVYYGSSLSKQGECLDGIKKGTVDMGVDVMTMYAGQYPYAELMGTPGINLGNIEQVTHTTLDYMKAYPDKELSNFKIIARFSSGTFGILTVDKQVTKAADLKGMSVRATSNFIPWYGAMGASGTFIPLSDLYQSLKLSVIGGAHTTVSAIYTFGRQEVTGYYTTLTMCCGEQCIAMSKSLYDSMPAEYQEAIDEISDEMTDVAINFVKVSEKDTMDNINKSNPNFKFVELTDIQGFLDAAASMLQEKEQELNKAGLDGTGALEWLQARSVK